MCIKGEITCTIYAKMLPNAIFKENSVERELKDLLEGDIIEKSMSQYTNSLVVVAKKNGKIRLAWMQRK